MKLTYLCFIALAIGILACKPKDDDNPPPTPAAPRLILKFKFDSTQARLNNIGTPTDVPAGRAAQSPVFKLLGAHYVELAPTPYTMIGQGKILYKATETTAGGTNAIDFSKSKSVGDGQEFFSMPLSEVGSGTYQYLRVSLAYQNYDISIKNGALTATGTIASFVGYNTYITSHTIKNKNISVNANRKQGYWGFEFNYLGLFDTAFTGQAPEGATTVPNPLSATSPIPAGSCVITGAFVNSAKQILPLTITGNEKSDIVITVSVSTNKSFEWKDYLSPDGLFEPAAGDSVVDMGLRGVIPIIN